MLHKTIVGEGWQNDDLCLELVEEECQPGFVAGCYYLPGAGARRNGRVWAWSLLVPVSLSAVACSWGLGGSRFNLKQAWVSLTVLGILGVFIYVGGLTWPLRRMTVAMLSLIPQIVLWISDKVLIDFVPLLVTWTNCSDTLRGRCSHLGMGALRCPPENRFLSPWRPD